MDWIISYVDTTFGEIYAVVLAGIFLLYILVVLSKPVFDFLLNRGYILGVWQKRRTIRYFPVMCKMYGFKVALKDLFRKGEREACMLDKRENK